MNPLTIPLSATHLLEASAGTGKTHAITTLFLRLLLEEGLSVERILVVTYTNAATAELRDRIRSRIATALAACGRPTILPDGEADVRDLLNRRIRHAAADQLHLAIALRGFDQAAISTIHGFCQSVLQERAFESGASFDAELMTDERPLRDEILRDFWVRTLAEADQALLGHLAAEDIAPSKLAGLVRKGLGNPDLRILPESAETSDELPQRVVALKLELIRQARRDAAQRKERRNVMTFDDLLVRVRDALKGDRGRELAAQIRERYAAALIDEFQDTDPIQYEIFRRIWHEAGAPLFLVGDPKQAIYAFRNADVYAYLEGKKVARAEHHLTINYRSDPGLLEALNRFFREAADPFCVPGIDYVPVEAEAGRGNALSPPGELTAPFRILFLGGAETKGARGAITADHAHKYLPRAVAGEIVRLLREPVTIEDRKRRRSVEPGDIAVLCRANWQAREMQEALQDLGVPAVLHGDRSVFESDEARELRSILEAMADPTDPKLVRAALATSLIGLGARQLAEVGAADEEWDRFAASFVEWREIWIRHGFMRAFRRLLDEQKIPARLLAFPRGERCLTNVLHIAELLHKEAVTGHRGPHELIDWYRREIEEARRVGELAPEELQIRLESDAEAVTLTTIHKAKGLEWPIVFCPYLWGKSGLRGDDLRHVRFHDERSKLVLDLGSSDHAAHEKRALEEARAEDLRLLYVALTRARHQCSIVWGGFTTAKASPLGHFLAPDGLDLKDDAAIRQHLETLAARSAGAIAVRALPLGEPPRFQPAARDAAALEQASFLRERLDDSWRTSSFTALTSAGAVSRLAREGLDLDEMAVGPTAAPQAAASDRVRLADFPAGARAGSLVHEILERIDFRRSDPDELDGVVASRLRAFGFEDRWREPLSAAIADVLEAPLRAGGLRFRLADVPRHKRLSEMEFTLPLGPEDGKRGLTPDALASVFQRYPSAAVPPDYAAALQSLGFQQVAGYLRGYVDLVFEHGGRFFLVDWKSNTLGPSLRDYGEERLRRAMAAHHYILQYHLYVATLDRYLERRVPGYDYDRNFGGVLYLFVRGIAPGEDTGIFVDRPPAARIADFSKLLERPEARR